MQMKYFALALQLGWLVWAASHTEGEGKILTLDAAIHHIYHIARRLKPICFIVLFCLFRIEYKASPKCVCKQLNTTLVGIQKGVIEDKMGWTVEID